MIRVLPSAWISRRCEKCSLASGSRVTSAKPRPGSTSTSVNLAAGPPLGLSTPVVPTAKPPSSVLHSMPSSHRRPSATFSQSSHTLAASVRATALPSAIHMMLSFEHTHQQRARRVPLEAPRFDQGRNEQGFGAPRTGHASSPPQRAHRRSCAAGATCDRQALGRMCNTAGGHDCWFHSRIGPRRIALEILRRVTAGGGSSMNRRCACWDGGSERTSGRARGPRWP